MKPVPFFTDDITVIPHTVSSELAHRIGKPVTLRQLQDEAGALGIALYELPSGDVYVALHLSSSAQPAAPLFAEGPLSAAAQAA